LLFLLIIKELLPPVLFVTLCEFRPGLADGTFRIREAFCPLGIIFVISSLSESSFNRREHIRIGAMVISRFVVVDKTLGGSFPFSWVRQVTADMWSKEERFRACHLN
jgi:hypothetical protein